MDSIRLNKYLSEMGICSRREADRLIEAGRVLVDGRPALMGEKVTAGQEVICGGKPVGAVSETGVHGKQPAPVLLAVNKPPGIVCTTSDKDRAQTIVDFIRYPTRIYPIGRLDKGSEGLLLMTNQGGLVNKILRGGNAHEKEYIVTVNRPVSADFLRKMSAGIALEELGAVTRPCRAERTGEPDTFRIVLTQGLNRQIRRMCEACGYRVQRLRRIRIMNIRLDGLETGAYRDVTPEEYTELLRLLKDSSDNPRSPRPSGPMHE